MPKGNITGNGKKKKKDAAQGREEGEPVPMKSEVSKDHKDPQLWAGRKDRYTGLLTP